MIENKNITEVHFTHCLVRRMDKAWGVFTHTPANDRSYIWFVEKVGKDSCTLIPTWTNIFKDKLISSTFEDCLNRANIYDEFCQNSEWF